MISIPGGNKYWLTAQNSDLFGHIVRTKNMDFNKEGYACLARKPMCIYSEDSDADFNGRFVAIVSVGSVYYLITSDHVFSFSPTSSALNVAEVTATGMPTITADSDAVQFDGALHVSGDTTVHSYAPTTWTSRITGLSASYPLPLCVFENLVQLAVGNGNTIKTYNTSYALQNTCTLPSKYVITSMRWRGNNLYIGTKTSDGSEAMMFIWNGSGTAAQQGYPVGARWVYSLAAYQNSIVALTSAGQGIRFNGGGFDTLFNLPVYYSSETWESSSYANTGLGRCINRGMIASGDVLYFVIDNMSTLVSDVAIKQPEGLWCFDPKAGLYHKAGLASEKYQDLTISTLSSNIFTMASAHGAETGDAVWASSVSNIPALTAGQTYYAIKTSTTALQLALSAADAYAGRAITASGTLSGDKLAFDVCTIAGSTKATQAGPVYEAPHMPEFFGSEVLFGGSATDPDGNLIEVFNALGKGRGVGSFVTPYLPTSGITDTLQKVIAKVQGLDLDTDKVVIKYRVKNKFGLPSSAKFSAGGEATWVDTTSFTILTTLRDVKSAAVGDEVEIVSGAGAGYSAHLTAINDATSTYTYTIDEAVTGGVSGDLSDLYMDNWTKLGTITNATRTISEGFLEQAVGKVGAYVQFKFELRGIGVSISTLEFVNSAHKMSK